MKIGVLGSGNVGGGLARLWEAKGHDVHAAGRDGITEAAQYGEVVVLAVPAGAVDEALGAAGSLEGKVLIDTTNDIAGARPSQAEYVASLAAGAKVVKAFNAAFAALYDQVQHAETPPPLVFCGDDDDAKETVAELIRDAGYEPLDIGPLANAPQAEHFGRLIIGIAYGENGRGPFVYRFVQP